MEMTLEQQRALALARARLRAQQQATAQETAAATPEAPVAPKPSFGEMFKQEALDAVRPLGNLAAGAVRGAGSIGATLLSPIDMASDLMAGRGLTLQSNRERRQAMDEGLRSMGADPDSLAFKAGKIGTEVAGTLPVGSILGTGARTVGASPVLVQALRSGGMSGGNLAARTAGGAATGAASAALVNPEDAGMGAAVGGALPLATRAAKGAVSAGREMLGMSTGVGSEPLRVAYEAGKAGGTQAQTLSANMRGQANMLDVLDDAKTNLETIRNARSAAYRQNMANVQADKTVLDVAPISQSVQDAINKFTFRGEAKNPQVLRALQEAGQEVSYWQQLDPANFHTPEGLDALKQRLGSIIDRQPVEARDVRSALSDVYNSVKRQIEAQAPEYSKAMKDYNEASDLIREIERSLSLNNRASADTAMRKLQSIMRNNVNTNYGARMQAFNALQQQGGLDLQSALAGQALNDWAPRGIQRATGALSTLGAGSLGGIPAAVGTAAASSPRLVGEGAFLAGQADPYIQALRRGLYRTAPVLAAQ